MRVLLFFLLAFLTSQNLFAEDTANIHLKINGAVDDNRYFFCIPDIGCLSILAGSHGRIYPIYQSFRFFNIYITNFQNFRVSAQPLPQSCSHIVELGQTISVFGNLVPEKNGKVRIENLRCSIKA